MEMAMPPSFVGHPWLYLATVFSLLLTCLLAMEWIWRIVWSFFERPAPLQSPTTAFRVIFLLLLVGAIIRSGPDVWLYMRWPAIDPAARLALSDMDNRLDAGAFIFLSLAWLFARLGEPMMIYQLEKKPLPIHLWPTREQLKRPAKIGVGVLVLAFLLTFGR